jgi:hypothetical protein
MQQNNTSRRRCGGLQKVAGEDGESLIAWRINFNTYVMGAGSGSSHLSA